VCIIFPIGIHKIGRDKLFIYTAPIASMRHSILLIMSSQFYLQNELFAVEKFSRL
jgi:hypothetical protein